MSDITFTASVPPRWSDKRIRIPAQVIGEYYDSIGVEREIMELVRLVRDEYEAERHQLLARIVELEAMVALAAAYGDKGE